MLVLRNRGLGIDPNEVQDVPLDQVVTNVGTGINLSNFSTTAATLLSTPITIGQNSVPIWAVGTLLISLTWLVTSAASGASRVTKKVSGRARKIRKGFTS